MDSSKLNEWKDFCALVADNQTAIFQFAYRMTGNRDDAEDLVQESMIEAFRSFHAFRPGSRFNYWVYRIMTHNYIDRYRKRKRIDLVSLDEILIGSEPMELADYTSDPQEVLNRNTWSESVQNALNCLSVEFRTVIILCDAQGLSYEDASKILKCPVGTIRSRLHRARAQMRSLLQSDTEDCRR